MVFVLFFLICIGLPDTTGFVGDFGIDYRKACHEMKICPHPQLYKKPPKKEENPDDSDAEGRKSARRPKKKADEEERVFVEHLQIYGWECDIATAAALQVVLPSVRTLTSLKLWGARASPKALRLIGEGLKDSTIQRLHLEFNPLTDIDDNKLSVRPTFPSRAGDFEENSSSMSRDTTRPGTAVIFDSNRPMTGDSSVFGSTMGASAMAAFKLNEAPIGDRLPSLVSLCASPNLQVISLRANKITDRMAIELFQSLLEHKSILSLNLWDNHIGDDAIPSLVSLLLNTKTLVGLSLGKNKITSKGAKALSLAFKAVLVDKEEAKKLKKEAISVTVGKTRAFRDANNTVRILNMGSNGFTDETLNLYVELADEKIATCTIMPVEDAKDKKHAKKAPKPEHGKGNRLEKIILSNNNYSLDMHIRCHQEELVEVAPLPPEVQDNLNHEAEMAALDTDRTMDDDDDNLSD